MPNTENIVEEVKTVVHEEIVTNFSTTKVISKLIAGGVTLITGCAMTLVLFMWELKSDIPLLKKGLIDADNNYSTLQKDVNGIRIEQGNSRDNQARMQEQLRNIEKKIDEQPQKEK